MMFAQKNLPECHSARHRNQDHGNLPAFGWLTALLLLILQGTAFAQMPVQFQDIEKLSAEERAVLIDMLQNAGNGNQSSTPFVEPEEIAPRSIPPRTAPASSRADDLPPKESDTAIDGTAQEQPADTDKDADGDELQHFGYDLFAGNPTTFAPATDIPVPLDYVLGPGDTVQVQLYGKENAQYDLTVSREGVLNLPRVGPITVSGLNFSALRQMLSDRIAKQYIGVNSSITLGRLRSIRIFVLGEAYRPGSYTVSALSTMTNALFVSGGIKPIGSLRNIVLKRLGKTITHLDLYDLLLNGDNSNDVRLQPGDVIFIPPVKNSISVRGEVRRPAIYEMRDEKTLGEALRLAGGLLPTAYAPASHLERINAKGERILLDVDLSARESLDSTVRDGDVLRVYSVLDRTKGTVKLSGSVQRPGHYQWRPGLRVSDILPSPDDLQPETSLDYALIRRENLETHQIEVLSLNLRNVFRSRQSPDNRKLAARDEIIVFPMSEQRAELLEPLVSQLRQQASVDSNSGIVNIRGAIRQPGAYPLTRGMRLSDLLNAAQGLKPVSEAEPYPLFAALQRSDRKNQSRHWQPVVMKDIHADSDANILLTPEDTLVIFSRIDIDYLDANDVQTALSAAESIANDEQQPHCAGIRYLASLAGSSRAASLGGSLLSASAGQGNRVRSEQECPDIFDRFPELLAFVLEYSVGLTGEVRRPGFYPVQASTALSELLATAGGPTLDADLKQIEFSRMQLSAQGDSKLLTRTLVDLQAGDQSTVVSPGDLVRFTPVISDREKGRVWLSGAFRLPGFYDIRRGERLSSLIKRAGGLTEQAYPYGAVFTRERIRNEEKRNFQRYIRELHSAMATAAASVRNNAGGTTTVTAMKQLIDYLSETEPVGRVVIEADPVVLQVRPELDTVLEAGDRIHIPKRSNFITVTGEVLNTGSFAFSTDLDAEQYVRMAGGYTRAADDDRVFVVLPNGQAQPLSLADWNFTSQRIAPGSTIVVPRDPLPFDMLTLTRDITGILSNLAIAAASLTAINN